MRSQFHWARGGKNSVSVSVCRVNEVSGRPIQKRYHSSVAHRLLVDDGTFPNSGRLPRLIYQDTLTLSGRHPARAIEQLFESHNRGNCWPAFSATTTFTAPLMRRLVFRAARRKSNREAPKGPNFQYNGETSSSFRPVWPTRIWGAVQIFAWSAPIRLVRAGI
jgi:hypothetical protein